MEPKVVPIDGQTATPKNKDDKVSSVWKDFTQTTGFHAINKLSLEISFKLRCFFWTLAVLCMFTYMSYNIIKELMNYYSYPTVTSMKMELVEELDFPAVTICNLNPLSKKMIKAADPKLESYFKKISLLGALNGTVDWDTEFSGPTFHESKSADWWINLYKEPESMFSVCFMKGVMYLPCTKAMKSVVTNYGVCGTFNFNASDVKRVQMAGVQNNFILYAGINHLDYVPAGEPSAGLRVALHDPKIHPDSATSVFLTAPGTTTYASVKKSTYKFLSPPYKSFEFRSCVDTAAPDFNNTLEFFDTYTYEHCVLECGIRKIHEICGCTKVQDSGFLGPICSLFNMTVCYLPWFLNISQNIEFTKSCGCKMPCSFQTYEAKVSTSQYPSSASAETLIELGYASNMSYLRNNFLEIRVYYENLMFQSTEQIPQYSTETLIGEIRDLYSRSDLSGNLGGHMGICLGASILTFTELSEFFITVCWIIVRRFFR